MKIRHSVSESLSQGLPSQFFPDKKNIFIDIETTGFSPDTSFIYMIGCVHEENNQLTSIQWLAQTPSEEKYLLGALIEYISSFNHMIHFNGTRFDIPFLQSRMNTYALSFNFCSFSSTDIYSAIRRYKMLLGLDSLKQKSLESYSGIQREDSFSGGELVDVYFQYSRSSDPRLEEILFLHNKDDILGMTGLLDLLTYNDLFSGNFQLESIIDKDRDSMTFQLRLPHIVPIPVQSDYSPFALKTEGSLAWLKVPVHVGELKYFLPEYREYYYLPVEDTAIHKSVACYVNSNFRQKAKASNCYTKKTGRFLPQFSNFQNPAFKTELKDKLSYFELTESFRCSYVLMKEYSVHILNGLVP